MKKLLMVAPYFLPRRRVGSLRPFKFAVHLKNYGWQPHILTIASDGQLTGKEQQLLHDIPVCALEPPFDRTGRSGSQLSRSKDNNKETSFSAGDWVDKHFPVDTWLPFFWMKWRQIKQIAGEIQPDAVWSTGDPWSGHWVGKKISKITGVPWMADFRDPWTLSETNLKRRSAFAAAWDQKIERNWIRKADMLSFTTDSTRKLYQKHYDDLNLDATTIYNAFDWKLFDNEGETDSGLTLDPQKLNLMFFGRFRRLSSAKPVIDILSRLRETYPSAAEKVAVHSFGPLTDFDLSYLKDKGVENCFVTQKPVPAEQGLQVLKKADLLLLSTNPERTDIIPAKFWDYLAAGRPILSIAPNPEIEQILLQTCTGVQYPQNKHEEVAKLIKNCVLAKEKGDQLPFPFSWDRQKINRYSAESATEKLVNILDQHSG